MVLTRNDNVIMTLITEFFGTQFKIKDLGSLSYFLGIQVTRTVVSMFMNQAKYISDILKEFDYLQGKASLVPMEQHHAGLADSDSSFLQNFIAYRRLIGRLYI